MKLSRTAIISYILFICISLTYAQNSDSHLLNDLNSINDPINNSDAVALVMIPYLEDDNPDIRLSALANIILTGSKLTEISQAEKELLNSEPPGEFRELLELGLKYSESVIEQEEEARSSLGAIPTEDCRNYDLYQGWDKESALQPNSYVELCQREHWTVTFVIHGALPNHQYTTGIHFFDPDDLNKESPVKYFDGKSAFSGCWTKNGIYACSSFLNFETLTTDGNGDGKVTLSNIVPTSGRYKAQFYLRAGVFEPQAGGPIAYHTGANYGDGIDTNVP